jgi:hypothetical protein
MHYVWRSRWFVMWSLLHEAREAEKPPFCQAGAPLCLELVEHDATAPARKSEASIDPLGHLADQLADFRGLQRRAPGCVPVAEQMVTLLRATTKA